MGKIKKKALPFCEIQGMLSGTSVNLEASKEWLKEDLASPSWPHPPNTLHTSETLLLHSWIFQDSRCPTSNLLSQPKRSTGSSPRDHTPVLWAFVHAVPLTWNAPTPALPLTDPDSGSLPHGCPQGAPAILPLVCVCWVEVPWGQGWWSFTNSSLELQAVPGTEHSPRTHADWVFLSNTLSLTLLPLAGVTETFHTLFHPPSGLHSQAI